MIETNTDQLIREVTEKLDRLIDYLERTKVIDAFSWEMRLDAMIKTEHNEAVLEQQIESLERRGYEVKKRFVPDIKDNTKVLNNEDV